MPRISRTKVPPESAAFVPGLWISYTPVVTAEAGTITAYAASGRYVRIGKTIAVSFSITMTDNGTGATTLRVTLPFIAAASSHVGAGVNTTAGTQVFNYVDASATYIQIRKYDGNYPVATGDTVRGSVTYESLSIG